MRAKSLTLSFFSIFIVAMLAIFVSAATIFSDDFDDGNLDGWTATGWTPDTGGTYAESNNQVGAILSRIVSTSGFQSIVVSYDRQLADSWETDNNFTVSWSVDGTTFTPLESVVGSGSGTPNDTSFVPKTFNLPSSANNNANFQIRFECNTNAANELCNVDNVLIEGTATPTEILACNENPNDGELKVKDIDFNNLGTLILKESSGNIYLEFGDDDEWFPLDEIEVEIEIENNGDFDIDDIEVEWGIYDTRSNKLIIEFDDEKDFNLKDGKDEVITVSFQLEDDLDIDLDELDDGKHYRFYVTATGIIDDSKAGDLNGDETCASGFDNAEIVIENDFVILTDVQYPETVQCGETVQISAKVWNIGDDDQEDISIDLISKGIGVDEIVLIGDIDAFDDDRLDFTFDVPNDAEEKFHVFTFKVLDEDFDVYENDFDDDDSEFTLPFRVSGGCTVEKLGVSISANIESGGKAGEDLVVRATVTNNDDESKVFTVNAAGFIQWASSYTADRTSLVLGAGDSVDVVFTFNVNKDASGSQSFTIELVSEDNEVTTQPVSVSIEGKRSVFGGLLTGAVTSGNAYLWGIAILNVILVLAIIIVAVRVLRK